MATEAGEKGFTETLSDERGYKIQKGKKTIFAPKKGVKERTNHHLGEQ